MGSILFWEWRVEDLVYICRAEEFLRGRGKADGFSTHASVSIIEAYMDVAANLVLYAMWLISSKLK